MADGVVTKAKLDGLKAGIADVLAQVNVLMQAEAYAEKLPIIGSKLATASPALETLTMLSNALQSAVNFVSDVSDLSSKSAAEVAQLLNDTLAPYLDPLRSAANKFVGTVGATVDDAGNIVFAVDMGRTIEVDFALGDLGMSGLGINLDTAGTGKATVAYNLDFRLGADATGFWFDRSASDLSFNTKVDLNGLSAGANLGILHFSVTNIDDSDPAADADTLKFDVSAVWNGTGLLRAFGSDIVDFKATGDVDLDLRLQGDLSSAALPSISADFHVDWGFSQSLLNGAGANSWSPATVGFTNVRYNFGSYVETVIRPIVDAMAPVLGPIHEALSFLDYDFQLKLPADWRVPLDINDDGKVTILDLIEGVAQFANRPIDTRPIADLLKTIGQIVDLAAFLADKDFSDSDFAIGDYSVQLTQVQGAVDALASLNIGTSGFTGTTPALGAFLNGLTGNTTGFGATSGGKTGATLITEMVGNSMLSFPLIENPLSAIKLLIGQDVDLFRFDMAPINIGTGLNVNGGLTNPLTLFSFPIWPLPLVQVQVNVAAQVVADLAFGYDTAGIRYWLAQEPAARNIADIFTHGFYFDDQRSGTVDVAEFILRAAVELAVITGVNGINVGGGGNVMGTVELNLADSLTTADGKLHLSDFPSQFGLGNPFAIFDVSGQVSVGGRAWLDLPLLGNVINYNSPRFTVFTFDDQQDATDLGVHLASNPAPVAAPPPGLADIITDNGVTGLWVAVGSRAGQRDIDDKVDGNEFIQIGSGSSGNLVVAGFGRTQSFATSAFTTIQIDAANGRDEIVIDEGVAVSARITGGAENDYLQGGDAGDFLYGGTEDDYLVGGAGADRLDGEDGNDRLEGGAGADALFGGNGPYDTASYANAAGVTLNLTDPLANMGDALGDTFSGIEIYEGSNANDTMVGSADADIFTALNGDDVLKGMGGDDTLAPGLGTNTIDGGDGFDIVNYYNIPTGVTVAGTATGYRVLAGPIDALTVNDTIVNVEQIDGTPYADTMTGGDANDIFVGRDGDDTLDGGAGDDTLVGGAGRDTLRGGAGTRDRASYILSAVGVTASMLDPGVNTGEAIGDTYQDIEGLRGSEYNDVLSGDNGTNLLQGGLGDDILNGNAGGDTLMGGAGADTLHGGDGKDIASYLNSTGKIVLNLQPGGADEGEAVGDTFNSIEVYQGSLFSDDLTGTDGLEELWGEDGNDKLHGMGGDDFLWGGAGNDQIWGEAGADIIEGSAGNDTISGGAGIDTIQGGDDNDTIHGDDDDDFIFGEDGSDTLYGDAGNDTIGGGAGADTIRGGANDDGISGGDGDDVLYGEAGKDMISGGQGNDLIDGGVERDTVTYVAAGLGGAKLNLGSTARVLGGLNVAAFSAIDNYGTTDTFVATGTIANVEDAIGSDSADWIVTNEGGSDIDARDGNDTVLGLGGSDVLRGGAGADALDGGDGNDTVNGGAGADDLKGGAGIDWVSYENDVAGVGASLAGNVATDGSGAIDTLGGFENLRGSQYGDALNGDAGANIIEGLDGDDIIDGGAGADLMYGGAGNDIFYFDSIGPGGDAAFDGDGQDLMRISVDMPLRQGAFTEDVQLIGQARLGNGNSLNNLMMGNALDNVLDGFEGGDTFWGYAGNDTYVFDSLSDTIGTVTAFRALTNGAGEVAGGGNDTIRLATANIWGGTAQNKTLYIYDLNRADLAHVENVELADNDRRVDLTGNALGNRLAGNDFGQILRGEGGDDVLVTGLGDDDVYGGAGLDTLELDWSTIAGQVVMNMNPTANVAEGGFNGEIRETAYGWYDYYQSIERFVIKTSAGNDSIVTATGDDIVSLGAGHDYVDVGSGRDEAHGGTGIDVVSADYRTDTAAIVWNLQTDSYSGSGRIFDGFEGFGTLRTGDGNDIVTTRRDVIGEYLYLGGGDDRVTLAGGDDDADGGSGTDSYVLDWSWISGSVVMNVNPTANATAGGFNGEFRETAYGWYNYFTSFERFEIATSAGNDSIVTATGDDIVSLGAGDDYVDVGSGRDEAHGGIGTDRITADYSTDTAAIVWNLQTDSYSGSGRVFDGFEGFGTLRTGDGNDIVTTRRDNIGEYLYLGGGDDRVTLAGGDDDVDGGSGTDTYVLDWSWISGAVAMNVNPTANATGGGFNGEFRETAFGWYNYFTSFERFEIATSGGNDSIVTATGDDIVSLGAGNDYVDVGSGRDEAHGGTGLDIVTADYSTDTTAIVWNLQADSYLSGGRIFDGFEGFGTLRTGSGNDIVTTRRDIIGEYLYLGGGDDRVTLAGGDDDVDGGSGTDSYVLDWSWIGGSVSMNVNPTANTALGGFNGEFRETNYGWQNSFVSFERFEIATSGGNDSIVTATGDDIVSLGAGDDYVDIGSGIDQADGGTGLDRISADYRTDTAAIVWNLQTGSYSGSGRSFTNFEAFGTLRTGSGNDVITTSASMVDELIYLGDGNDRVTMVRGDDDAYGGLGDDTYVLDWSGAESSVVMNRNPFKASGADAAFGWIAEFRDTARGWYNYAHGFEHFEITTGGSNDSIVTADGNDIVRLGGGNDFVTIGSGRDEADGGTGVDGISADYSSDTTAIVWNLAGNSYSGGGRSFANFEYFGTLRTGSGNDVITTSAATVDEVIYLGGGDDRIVLVAGDDDAHGGAGNDTYVLDWSAETGSIVTSQTPTGDAANGWSGEFRATGRGWYNYFTSFEKFEIKSGSAGDSIVTAGGDDIVRAGAGNDYIETRGGNDLLDGGTGDDTMVGGTGNDSYIVDSLGDVVVEAVNDGIDSVSTGLIAYTLAANIETLIGINDKFGQALTGNALDNVISGSAFGDILDGAGGDDTLYGGDGNDFFKMGSGANNALFGEAGIDTLVLTGTLANYVFSTTGDGRVKVVDTRDPTGTIGYLSSIERVEIEGGSITLEQAMAGNVAAKQIGTSGNDTVQLTVPRQVVSLTQGGSDAVTGTTDVDYILFGPSLDPTDTIDARDGIDQLGLQGNYNITFGSNILGIDYLALLSGSNTDYGDTGTHFYSYKVTTTNATVAGGAEFYIQANALLADESLVFDGSAEMDGSFFLAAGFGIDTVKGGANSDRFFFGEGGRFTPADSIDGTSGTDDQLGLRGDYATTPIVMTATSMLNIDTLVLLSGTDLRFGAGSSGYNYDITTVDANVAAGAQLRVSANTLQSDETVRFDGSAETNGSFFLILGNGADVVKGGAGADVIFGSGGGDTMTGGGGADTYIYLLTTDSAPDARDTIADFASGDRIDLSRIDAIAGGDDDAFTFIGTAAFATGVAGQVRVTGGGTAWLIEADIDGNGNADLVINVTSDHAPIAADFIL